MTEPVFERYRECIKDLPKEAFKEPYESINLSMGQENVLGFRSGDIGLIQNLCGMALAGGCKVDEKMENLRITLHKCRNLKDWSWVVSQHLFDMLGLVSGVAKSFSYNPKVFQEQFDKYCYVAMDTMMEAGEKGHITEDLMKKSMEGLANYRKVVLDSTFPIWLNQRLQTFNHLKGMPVEQREKVKMALFKNKTNDVYALLIVPGLLLKLNYD